MIQECSKQQKQYTPNTKEFTSYTMKINGVYHSHRKFKQFDKDNANTIERFTTPPRRLNKMITTEEVTITEMANNKAPGNENNNVELIKYAPKEIHKEISNILNDIFENNDNEIKLGTGILLPLPKPKIKKIIKDQ